MSADHRDGTLNAIYWHMSGFSEPAAHNGKVERLDLVASLDAVFETARRRSPHLAALLFDLDGTLVETMSLHYDTYRDVIAEDGGWLERADFDRLSGPPARVTIPRFVQAAGLPCPGPEEIAHIHSRKKKLLAQRLKSERLPLLPAGLLARRHAGNFRYGLVTSGNADGAAALLKAGGLDSLFRVQISGDDVSAGKPAPMPYQQALAALGVCAGQALAFEDHDDGIASALGAGVDVIDVRDASLKLAGGRG